jgi:hypothetical protein
MTNPQQFFCVPGGVLHAFPRGSGARRALSNLAIEDPTVNIAMQRGAFEDFRNTGR